MKAAFRKIHGARAVALTLLEGMDAVEPHAPGAVAIGIEVGQRRRMPPGIPFLAGGGAGMTADAQIEVDHQAELFLPGVCQRQIGHSAASRFSSPPKVSP